MLRVKVKLIVPTAEHIHALEFPNMYTIVWNCAIVIFQHLQTLVLNMPACSAGVVTHLEALMCSSFLAAKASQSARKRSRSYLTAMEMYLGSVGRSRG